jgi:class I fructose-bisphosphate aldolase
VLKVSRAIQAAFSGKRIVIFSGGAQKSSDDVIDEVREINAGGGFGSILGRNAFQRPRAEGIDLLRRVIGVYRSG